MSSPSTSSTSPSSSNSSSRASDAHDRLSRLLSSWKSRYGFIIRLKEEKGRAVHFTTEWCLPPTPSVPLPPFRVYVTFTFLYPSPKTDPNWTTTPPKLSYRIEQEQTVYMDVAQDGDGSINDQRPLPNIDHHIHRVLDFKRSFASNHPLPLHPDEQEFLRTRFSYEPLDQVKDDAHTNDTMQRAAKGTAAGITPLIGRV